MGLAFAATGVLGAALIAQPAVASPPISASAPGGEAAAAAAAAASSYLAGYQVTEPGISRASVRFHVPAMTCTTNDTQGTLEGIGNEEAVGFPTVLAGTFDTCQGGSPSHSLYAQAGGNITSGAAATGDVVSILIVQTRTKVTARITDVTTGVSASATGSPTPDNSLTFGSFPLFGGGMLPVADFGNVRMMTPTLENSDLRAWSPTSVNRKNGSITQIATRAFDATNGAFTLAFRNH